MDIMKRLRTTEQLTGAEQGLARTIIALGARLEDYTIKELAQLASCSVATIHRLCRKLGLEGYKQLKLEMARCQERLRYAGEVDINFPFGRGWESARIASSMHALYSQTLSETHAMLDEKSLTEAATMLSKARLTNLITESHNRYPANMFVDRMLSIGHLALCEEGMERQLRTSLAMGPDCVALCISYSGISYALKRCLPVLQERGVPVFLIGTPAAAHLNPGLSGYLCVSDAERYQGRIAQFASHLAVHYALDVLFGCVCAQVWDDGMSFLQESLPLTRKEGLGEERALLEQIAESPARMSPL